jgi:cytidine deaminase
MHAHMMQEQLIKAAAKAREAAYAPYSHFQVGAAALTDNGILYTGCNIENASYGLTVCAERTAIFSAIAAGEKRIAAVAVIADTPEPTAPCGACRQVMAEFGVEDVIMANTKGEICKLKLRELLPYSFSGSDIRS